MPDDSLSKLDRLIHEPARLIIMAVLYAVEEADFLYLLRETSLTKGNLSVHLTRLENGGYIGIDKSFVGKKTRTVCRMTRDGRIAFQLYQEQLNNIMKLAE